MTLTFDYGYFMNCKIVWIKKKAEHPLAEDVAGRGERGTLDVWVRWTALNIFAMP